MRSSAEAFLREVVPITPVDGGPAGPRPGHPIGNHPGQARGGWQVGLGSAPSGQTGRLDTEGDETINAGVTRLKQYNILRHFNLHVTNNVDYMTKLNGGSSIQAPPGFIEEAAQRANIPERIRVAIADF
jgi:hypothetical protein